MTASPKKLDSEKTWKIAFFLWKSEGKVKNIGEKWRKQGSGVGRSPYLIEKLIFWLIKGLEEENPKLIDVLMAI